MDEQVEAQSTNFMELTANLIAAYVSKNSVPMTGLPDVIASVHATLTGLSSQAPVEPAGPERPTSAQIRKSITPDALISFIDGKRYKTLKRHVTGNGLSFEEYRTRYGLPADYPSTSASYSARRSALARSLGLGQIRRKSETEPAAVDKSVFEATKTRGRKPKVVEAAKAVPKAKGRKKAVETA